VKVYEDEQKLQDESIEVYSKQVKSLTDRVKLASSAVEYEAENIRALQRKLKQDPFLRLSNFRDQSILLKASLTLSLLFFVRGGADVMTAIATGEQGHFVVRCRSLLFVS
jgi:hypothetical protein